MNEFLSWADLATYGGAVAATVAITQFTKGLPGVDKLPTQLWSFLVALTIMVPAIYFTTDFSLDVIVLVPFNAIVVSLAANGGYEAIQRVRGGLNA